MPSLYEACHEAPYKPGSSGFATWTATKWPWFGEFTERGYLCVAVHRGKNPLVSQETAALLDRICRAETERIRAEDAGWRRCGALVARSVTMREGDGEAHTHSSHLFRWDQAYRGDHSAAHADPATALGDLVAAAVRAAVVVQEAEARRWFSWQWYWTDTLIADLIRAGRLRRVDDHLAATSS